MKSLICMILLAGVTGVAAANPPEATREKSVMLYFTKSFGSTQKQNRTPLAFGLRLQQSAPFDPRINVALADFRYSLGGVKELSTFGALAMRLGEDEVDGKPSSSSSGPPIQEHPVRTGIVIGLGALGLACIFKAGICDGSDDPYDTNEDPPPTTPGT